MNQRKWVILGATSIIAREFAQLAAKTSSDLLLVGRNKVHLSTIATDLQLRHKVNCEILSIDLSADISQLLDRLENETAELDLFIAQCDIRDNDSLDRSAISKMIQLNVLNIAQLIHSYIHRPQQKHQLIFLSSVAASRGRKKNSLYGASKAAIEIYLEGLQQDQSRDRRLTIVRLGYIDTQQTFGMPGIFYAASPENCAKACWKALHHKKNFIYYPIFWRPIMWLIGLIPTPLYKRIGPF